MTPPKNNEVETQPGQGMSVLPEVLDPLTIRSFEDKNSFLIALKGFLAKNMQAGVDFGHIPLGPDRESKATLFKPGAEKLLNFFSYSASFEVSEKLEDHEKGYFFYKYRCSISDQSGRFIGDGFGSANTKEAKWNRQSPFDVLNTVDKMAQKRALIQAVLLATRASEFYTQDLEDMSPQALQAPQRTSAVSRQRQPLSDFSATELSLEEEIRAVSVEGKMSKSGKEYRVVYTLDGKRLFVWDKSMEIEAGKDYKVEVQRKGDFMTIIKTVEVKSDQVVQEEGEEENGDEDENENETLPF